MKRGLVAFAAAGLMAVSMAGAVSAAPPGVDVNPNSKSKSDNCIAIFSSEARHNGQAPTLGQGGDPSHGTRGDEIKALQDSCNNANDK